MVSTASTPAGLIAEAEKIAGQFEISARDVRDVALHFVKQMSMFSSFSQRPGAPRHHEDAPTPFYSNYLGWSTDHNYDLFLT
jgi:hypothetical protein